MEQPQEIVLKQKPVVVVEKLLELLEEDFGLLCDKVYQLAWEGFSSSQFLAVEGCKCALLL